MKIKNFLLTLLTLAVFQSPARSAALYQMAGFSETVRIGDALYQALDDKSRAGVSPHPVALETETAPYVRSGEHVIDGKPLKLVFISVGFLELTKNMAHAKAIDGIEPGYFNRYVAMLAADGSGKEVVPLPNDSDARYASEVVLNNKRNFFGQMVGMVLAIELSHHYLGHYQKYSTRLAETADGPTPINTILTKSEWDKSVEAGAENSLSAGYASEGVRALYVAIEKMAKRPGWTAYFVPQTEKMDKLAKRLVKTEQSFFNEK